MNFSAPLGPSATARPVLDEPGDRLLWAAYGGAFYYDIDGLDATGAPQKNVLKRGLGAVGGFALDMVGEALTGGSDVGSADKPPPPDVVVFGRAPECLAAQRIRPLGPGARRGRWLWALTAARLAVLGPAEDPAEVSKPDKNSGGSFLSKAIKFGKDVAKVVADRRERYGPNIEGEPIARAKMKVWSQFARAEIGGVAVDKRRTKLSSRPCLRVSFVDGSGLDFVLGIEDPAVFEYMAALTHGGR